VQSRPPEIRQTFSQNIPVLSKCTIKSHVLSRNNSSIHPCVPFLFCNRRLLNPPSKTAITFFLEIHEHRVSDVSMVASVYQKATYKSPAHRFVHGLLHRHNVRDYIHPQFCRPATPISLFQSPYTCIHHHIPPRTSTVVQYLTKTLKHSHMPVL